MQLLPSMIIMNPYFTGKISAVSTIYLYCAPVSGFVMITPVWTSVAAGRCRSAEDVPFGDWPKRVDGWYARCRREFSEKVAGQKEGCLAVLLVETSKRCGWYRSWAGDAAAPLRM